MNTEQRDTLQSRENIPPRGIPLHTEHDDAQLVKASQRGDQQAFALLVQRHQQRVFALSMRLLQDPEEANEATQEAFLAAWQGLSGFRGDALFSSWLYRIAYHCCMHVIDLRTREHLLQEAMHVEQARSEMAMEQQAMENIERYELRVLLQKNLQQLPAKYRIVLRLRYLQDRTYEEMAAILAMPLGTIKTSLFRAKRLLKERLLAPQIESTL